MSHVASMDTAPGKPIFSDIKALRQAAKMLGCELVERNTYKWYGTSVGDFPLPPGVKAEDLGNNAKYVIQLTAKTKKELNCENAYEVGIIEDPNNPGCYLPMYDFWQGGYGINQKLGDPIFEGHARDGKVKTLLPKLMQQYHMVCDSYAAAEAGDKITFLKTADAHKKFPQMFPAKGDQDTWVSIVDTSARITATR